MTYGRVRHRRGAVPVAHTIASHLLMRVSPEPVNEIHQAAHAAIHESAHAFVADKYGLVEFVRIGRQGTGHCQHVLPVGESYAIEAARISLAGPCGENQATRRGVFGDGFEADYLYTWKVLARRFPDPRERLNQIARLNSEVWGLFVLEWPKVENLAGHLLASGGRVEAITIRRVFADTAPSLRRVFHSAMNGRVQ